MTYLNPFRIIKHTNESIKFSLDEINYVIAKYVGCTRNEIMVKCFEFALEHMEVLERQDGTDRPQK